INGVFYAIKKYGTDQTEIQRYLTARSDRSAIRASCMGILLTVPEWSLFMSIGTALFVYYTQQPFIDDVGPNSVFSYFIMTQLPVGVVGFILAAMISAAICSLSADLNSLAAVGIEDYYKKLRPEKVDNEYLRASRWMVAIAGILSMLIGFIYVELGSESILGIIFTLYAIFSGGIVGVFLLGIFKERANRQGINIAIVVCVLFTAYAFLTSTEIEFNGKSFVLLDLGEFNFTHNKMMLGVYSHLVVIVVGYVASLFFPKPELDPNLYYRGWKANRKLDRERGIES